MASKRYPNPYKQIDAGYFWLTIGLALSLVIVLTKPAGRVTVMFGLIGYGLFHVVAGKRNLQRVTDEELADDMWWLEDAKASDSDAEIEVQSWLGESSMELEEDFFAGDTEAFVELQDFDSVYDSSELLNIDDDNIFSQSWRDPIYGQDENDDVEDPPDLIVYSADYADWDDDEA